MLSACGGSGGGDGITSYIVSATTGSGGRISPISVSVEEGKSVELTAIPDFGYAIADVSGCGGVLSGNTYTTGPISDDCTVKSSFSLLSFAVTGSAGSGGSITSASNIDFGSTAALTLTPDIGYEIDSVSGCGGVLSGNTYTTAPVSADCTVSATFSLQSFGVTGTAGPGGSITPAGSSIDYGSTTALILTTDTGYEVDSISGCGGTLSGSTYTTGPITADCTVNANFALQSLTVTGTAGSGGSITPSSSVDYGTTTTLTLTPDTGYEIDSVSGCGGTLSSRTYTTGTIITDCTVSATFGMVYSVGGSVTGLNSGNEVVLNNNGGDVLTVSSNTGFTFPAAIFDGTDYSVTVAVQPAAQSCTVSNGSGTVTGADITNVAVSCITVPPDAPTVALGYGIKTLQFSWEAVPGATYYRLLENPDGVSGYSVVVDGLTATLVSHTIALYNRINALYLVEACNSAGCTDSMVIPVANHLVDAIGYVKASSADPNDVHGHYYDRFGYAVSLSSDGTTLAVGAPHEGNVGCGAVYVFTRSGSGWGQQAYLKASNPGSSDNFGYSVSLSADGNTLAVGAYGEGSSATGVDGDQYDNSAPYSGAVYLFGRTEGIWSQQAYLKAQNVDAADYFGYSVSLSADGSTLAVGARYEDSSATGVNGDQSDNSTLSSGAVYLFARNADIWSQQVYLKASNTGDGDMFGTSLCLSADGKTLAVGAVSEDSSATGVDGDHSDNSVILSGAVYLFTRSVDTWSQQAYLKASNTGSNDGFGHSVSLSSDGNTLAVGVILEDSSATSVDGDQGDNSARDSGAVYLFGRSVGTWSQQAYLKASNAETYDYFGNSVSLSADGNTLAVGASKEDGGDTGVSGDPGDNSEADSGAVYLFTRSVGTWRQHAYLKASNTGAGDEFGTSLCLSSDGNTLAVGGPFEDSGATGVEGDQSDNGTPGAGAVYLY